MISRVFVAAVALQKKFLLSNKISRNPGSLPKTYTHVSSTSGKYTTGFLAKSFGGCCGNTVLTGAYCWPSSDRIAAQKIVSMSTELNHNHSALVLDSYGASFVKIVYLTELAQKLPSLHIFSYLCFSRRAEIAIYAQR